MFIHLAALFRFVSPLLRRTAVATLAALAAFLTYQQLQTDIYDFPTPQPFSGDSIYNPYANLHGRWYKANFHAHTKSYSGLTYGTKSARYVIGKYQALDYDIINISDYFSMKNNASGGELFMDVYEHGLNLFKTHRLVIGASSVDYFDFSFNFTLSNKQYMLHRLENECRLLAIAHPEFGDGHTRDDVKYLTGYQCMEVLNHLRTSTAHWDSALSAGKPVWLIAGDDSHSSSSILECGRTWTMVNVEKKTPDHVLSSLQTGRAYGASGMFAENRNMLQSVTVNDSTVKVTFADTIDIIAAITDGGKIKKIVRRNSMIECPFSANDSYLRFEASDTVHEFSIYLNPLIRFQGGAPPANIFAAKINIMKTVLWKFFVSLLFLSIMTVLYYKPISKLLRRHQWDQTPVFESP